MTPEEKYELFEKHCSQELSINEKARLTKLLQDDDVLKEELKMYQEAHSHLDRRFNSEKEQATLKKNLESIGSQFFSKQENNEKTKKEVNQEIKEKSKVIKMPSWVYAVAASVAIIIGAYFFNQNDPVYHDYADIPKLSIVERGGQEESIKNAEKAFNSKNYVVAEKYLSALLSNDKNNSEYQFYYAVSLLEQNKHIEATQAFKMLHQGKSVYKHKALWFEALNQLKQKRYDQCSKLLKKLPKEAEDYNNAQKLLKKLN